MTTIAFIGLGNMGAPMAANLVKAGHATRGFDLMDSARAAAAKSGVAIAKSGAEALEGAEVVVTMLPAGKHVLSAWSELAPRAAKGALLIDSSTIDVESSRKAHALAKELGLLSLDAPVSGGVGGASAGTLTFMCGGAGAGQAAKICNNMILGATMIATCEAFALGEKLGLSHQSLFDVVSTSSGQSWSTTSYCPVPGPVPAAPSNNGYKPGFASALMLKDLKLAQEAAISVGATTPMGALAAQLYAMHNAWGEGGADFSAIIQLLRGKL